jgi:FkbM family methyltransferase
MAIRGVVAGWLHKFMKMAGHDCCAIGLDRDYLVFNSRGRQPRMPGPILEKALLWEHLKVLLENNDIDLVLDIGANLGEFAIGLRRIGFTGHIVSFEPIPKLAEQLSKQSAHDRKWTVLQVALDEEPRVRSLNVANFMALTSCRTPSEYGLKRFGAAIESEFELSVQTERLDAILARELGHLKQDRVFLKLDTQGSDIDIFRGLGAAEDRIVLLQTELAFAPLYEGVPLFWDAGEFFRRRGFQPSGLFPVCRDPNDHTLVEIDCVMVRSNRSTPLTFNGVDATAGFRLDGSEMPAASR